MGSSLVAALRRRSPVPSRAALLRGAAAFAVLALAGCETASGIRPPGRGIAEIADTDPKAASANIDSLTEVIRRNPSSAEAYNTRGVAYARVGRFSEAIADFSQAVKLDANNAAAYTNRALASRQIGQNDSARADFDRAIQVNPNHAPAYVGRANLLRAQGNLDQAQSDLDTAIRLNPESAQAFHARGLIHQKRGDNTRAVTDFDNAIDRDPFAAAPYQARGESLVSLGKYDKAIEDFNAALNVDNKSALAWAWLGLAYDKSGNRQKAQESYRPATRPAATARQTGRARVKTLPGSHRSRSRWPRGEDPLALTPRRGRDGFPALQLALVPSLLVLAPLAIDLHREGGRENERGPADREPALQRRMIDAVQSLEQEGIGRRPDQGRKAFQHLEQEAGAEHHDRHGEGQAENDEMRRAARRGGDGDDIVERHHRVGHDDRDDGAPEIGLGLHVRMIRLVDEQFHCDDEQQN